MANKKKAKINLLQRGGFSDTLSGRVLAWVLTSFRVIVIVTEILVMLAFLSRFWLDAQNSDLNEKIKQTQAVLAASLPFEQEFKNTQARLKVFSDYTKNDDTNSRALTAISSALPPDVVISQLAFSGTHIEMKGFSPGERSIQQFLVNMAASQELGNVVLGEVATSENEQLLFEISIALEGE